MKIFLSFLQSPKKHPIPAYDFWQYYIKSGIEEAGHDWVEHPNVDWAYGLVPQSKADLDKWRDEVWSKTLTMLKEHPADLFLSYLYPEQIDTGAIEQIKKMGIPCVNFYCDNVRHFKSPPTEFGVFNLNWVPEFKALKMYKKAGYPFVNLPMPMWIAPELRTERDESIEQVTFIGSKDLQRARFFEEVVTKAPDINLHIYGNGWSNDSQSSLSTNHSTVSNTIANQFNFLYRHGIMAYRRKIAQRGFSSTISDALLAKVNGIIDFDTYNKLTSGSMITVGVNRYPSFRFPLSKPDSYPRLRDIEAPMLGACYLTEYTEGLDQMYEFDKEISVYKNANDFIEKVKELSCDKALRKAIRTGGQQRALSEHSIPQSLNKLIEKLK